ncbi:Non-receptor tyrosine kinase [Cavenderia fasciculata]|uniref:Non-receptor tyrosine kinase n=1 Tax=Cavenderia fasciculata TaxID=261658 RepID=F4Q149_CACFS|nr:Non-receptor tyrosine kinase [Cavenderia fasciculata]EGG18550.1 Non-receptor tyrosine kinase [Cavenderia fasciculata]|eukprot:XP_004366454.1 Non-receptor tyrosine kinase [Cavenderia fasciculata]
MFGVNNPYSIIQSRYPIKLPSIIDVIKESLATVKSVELIEDQTPLFWSLSHVLTELPLIGDKIIQMHGYSHPAHATLFVSPTGEIPRISIPDYLVRLVKFSPCSKECFIMIIVYIDRLIQKAGFIVNSFNIHRLLITCIMVASKYIDDIFYNNEYYSHIGGVNRDELNKLEIAFLTLLEFDTSCPLPNYLDYFSHLDCFVSHIRQIRQKSQPQLQQPSLTTLTASSTPMRSNTNIICNSTSATTSVISHSSIVPVTESSTKIQMIANASVSSNNNNIPIANHQNNSNNNNNVTMNNQSNTNTSNISSTSFSSSSSGSRRKSLVRDPSYLPVAPTIISN